MRKSLKVRIALTVSIWTLFIAYYLYIDSKPQESPKTEQVYTCIQYNDYHEDIGCKVFGYSDTLSEDALRYEWRLKPRKTPERLMIAKAKGESNKQLWMYRLEKKIGQISCGLFQPLGADAIELSIQDQMAKYDSMMYWCLQKGDGDIKRAIFYYNTPYGNYYEGAWWVTKTLKNY